MRTLSTRILSSSSEGKKKIYPVNHVDEDYEEILMADEDDEDLYVASDGRKWGSWCASTRTPSVVQDVPELARCYTAYVQARQRLRDKAKSRGLLAFSRKGLDARAEKGWAIGRAWPSA